jgi:N-acetylmuramoyl-L-alanine amidase
VQQAAFESQPRDAAWWQRALAEFGYELAPSGSFDAATRSVIAAFQMRYRPARHDGVPDAETAAMLHVLLGPAPGP